MATPTLRALREHFGGELELIGIMRPHVTEVLQGSQWLNETLLFDRRSTDVEQRSWALARQLRRIQLDALLLLTNSLRAAAIAWAGQARQRIGYVRNGRGPLLTDRLYPPRTGRHLAPISAVDYFLQLTHPLGVTPRSKRLELATTEVDEQRADRLWRRYGLGSGRPVVVLAPGGAYGSAKQWPAEYFAELARRLTQSRNASVLIVCGAAERPIAARIEEQAGSPHVHNLANKALPLGLSKATIRRSDLLIANDSGPRHFGAAFEVPTVTLFGPTDPRWSETFHPRAVHLQRPVPCGPCAKRRCPLVHHRCMRDLTVDQVLSAADRLLTPGLQRQTA
jgi:heptosyltransferase-2